MIDIASLIYKNRSGSSVGLPCFCTANEQVLRAVFQYAKTHQVPAVIEATCNQVNQDGGYTGMTATDFKSWMETLATEYNVNPDTIILGGDHLGPNPWRHLPAEEAMEKAGVLVRDYAAAGFKKIHLDASMACGKEPTPSFELVAERAARLCKIAEDNSPNPEELNYIIGTEVPIPGGETDDMAGLTITSVERLSDTIETHRHAFDQEGLSHVWPKIVSVVTQPGVDFSHTSIHRFEPEKAEGLANAVTGIDNMTFEAHSTDYQPTDSLAQLVNKHFFFLKVGPELTFRMREAIFALAHIENHLMPEKDRSGVITAMDLAMKENSEYWVPYYQGSEANISQLRHFSYSDRIRYYWTVPNVRIALQKLFSNLNQHENLAH
jgi:D-tagatose-1,6-bisphosphate aldolase subunit GatZ/KbaZ